MPSESAFYASLIFGAIGMGALLYGKTTVQPKKMILGAIMIGYTYFIYDAWLLWGIGVLLCFALALWND
jgi:hypothetical protein